MSSLYIAQAVVIGAIVVLDVALLAYLFQERRAIKDAERELAGSARWLATLEWRAGNPERAYKYLADAAKYEHRAGAPRSEAKK